MDLQLNGKTAIVTAATAGIGLAIARRLAQEGAAVTLTGRDREKLAAAVAPQTDILINNLGFYEATPFAEIDDDAWHRMFDVNVMSGVRLSRHYFPMMLRNNQGRVIFISSEVGAFTPPDMIHYGVSKSAQLAVSRGMAELTKGTGVTVNSVLPSATRSEGIMDYLRQTAPQPGMTDAQIEAHFFATYRPSSLLARMIEADEIAAMVALLASPLGAASNGAAVRVEGGTFRSIL
ncbi:SDR family oxidoreductase [Cronobacter dublinensis subsp. beijingensis]|uniref:SDR family NAD(P)-dependent oxidoreductase n=1 Tax=Cronobacter dublinensis TaxID=413497 RepID=UPI0023DC20D1|nr:SDR family oxidoreductase [Cronobacter dublinensis]WEP48203.1 SDR family oxidoreductase [Cronobacter dublinensis]